MLPTTQTILSISAGLSLSINFALAGPLRLPRDTSLLERETITFKAPVFGPFSEETVNGVERDATVEVWNSLAGDELKGKFGYNKAEMAFLDFNNSTERTTGVVIGTGASKEDPEYTYVKRFGDVMVDGASTRVVDILVANEGKMVEAVYRWVERFNFDYRGQDAYALGDRLELVACTVLGTEGTKSDAKSKCKVVHHAESEKVAETRLATAEYTDTFQNRPEEQKDEVKKLWAEAVPSA